MTARIHCSVLVLVACLTLLACATPPPPVADVLQPLPTVLTAQPTPVADQILLGIYYGNQGLNMDQVRHMESWQGKKYAVVNLFTNWCNRTAAIDNLFQNQLLNIWKNGNVPIITWEPYLCSPAETPQDVEVRAARGEYDAYFVNWADHLKGFLSGPDMRYNTGDDRRAYIRLGHEMNGNWYPWSAALGNNAPADYIKMWKRVKSIFDVKSLDSTRLQWIWAVNNDDVGSFPLEQYYPGDSWVDWVAVDGFNFGESQSWSHWRLPAACYDQVIGRLRKLTTKPIALVEFASSSSTTNGNSVATKSAWIADLLNYVVAKKIKMIAWFNEDKETDWALFGGMNGDGIYVTNGTTYKTYDAYKTGVSVSNFVAADSKHPRYITDAQFAGQ